MLVCSWLYEFFDWKICFNVIVFGVIDILLFLKWGKFVEWVCVCKVEFVEVILVGCMGMVDDIVCVVFYFVSDELLFVVGIELVVDGGVL